MWGALRGGDYCQADCKVYTGVQRGQNNQEDLAEDLAQGLRYQDPRQESLVTMLGAVTSGV